MFLESILFLFSLTSSLHGLKSSELCQKVNSTYSTCHGSYRYDCILFYCAVNKHACNDFIDFTSFTKSISSETKIAHVTRLINRIKDCPTKEVHVYSEKICYNTNKCLIKDKFSSCPCNGKLAFKCGIYCTFNEDMCKEFQLNYAAYTKKPYSIHECGKLNFYINNF